MSHIVNNKQGLPESIENNQVSASAEFSRRPYLTPRLASYGRVAAMTKNGGASGSDGTGSSMTTTMGSDSSIKENIVRIGNHPLGIGLYLYDYKTEFRDLWGHGRQLGVMAHEVEAVMPEAVVTHSHGYKVVDYGMLGIARSVH